MRKPGAKKENVAGTSRRGQEEVADDDDDDDDLGKIIKEGVEKVGEQDLKSHKQKQSPISLIDLIQYQ